MEAEVFESRSEVGGTWTSEMSYHGLQVHSPMYTMPGIKNVLEKGPVQVDDLGMLTYSVLI